ncbi:hypothetical protein PLANPX_5807 [Lacipirellula parvula]|uniref:Uncharacterized protein n=1 Tax=Lacipirellula parvula TaxID=2650471 RepID=A0A5K7XIG0_9BACT|nr:hypothetical protein PLANPX_5807 [Lacipirellula parvula]
MKAGDTFGFFASSRLGVSYVFPFKDLSQRRRDAKEIQKREE